MGRGDVYGHLTEADPRFIHPVVVGERAPLLGPGGANNGSRAIATAAASAPAARGTGTPRRDEETTVITEDMPMAKVMLIIGTCWIGVFMGAVDSTIIATLSGPIASEFESLSIMSWLATAYFISLSAFQPISGRLTDIFGRGPGLVFSNLCFAAGNLVCGLSQGPGVMILGRVIAGLGGGGLMCIASFLSSDLVPLRKRGLFQGLGNIFYGSGAMVGGVIGGLFHDNTKLGWRLAFLVMVPPSIVSAILVAVLVKVPPKQSDRSYLSRIDFTGVLLIISSLVLLLLGLNAGGNLVPWSDPFPLTTISLSVVGFVGFFCWERRVAYPVIPMEAMLSRTVMAVCLCNFFGAMATMACVFYLPLYLQVRGDSVTMAGVKLLPSPFGTAAGSLATGLIMNRTGKYMVMAITSVLMMSAGFGLLTLQSENSALWVTLFPITLGSIGYGGMLTTTLLACLAAVEHSQQAVITSATYLYRSVGGTLGITIAAAVYQNILKAELWRRFGDEPNAAEEIGRIRDSLEELKRLPAGWHEGVIKAFMKAFGGVWLALLGLGVLGLVSICFMQQHKLHSTISRR